MAELPVDFEQKVKQPAPPNGQGYPVQLSARDLMLNFKFINDRLPEPGADGQMLVSLGDEWATLNAGAAGQVLTISQGLPAWVDPESGGGSGSNTFVVERDTDPQITVTFDGTDTYTVEGNGASGSLTITEADATEHVLTWEDGLITPETSSAMSITLPAVPEVLDDLDDVILTAPAAGDVLYYNGADWVNLVKPAAPTGSNISVLTHDGTAPSWKTLTAESVSLCDAGTSTTKTFYTG